MSTYNRFSRLAVFSSFVVLGGIIVLLVLSLFNEYRVTEQHARTEVENLSRLLDEHALATVQKVDLLLREIQRNIRPDDMRVDRGIINSRRQGLHALLKSQTESVPEVTLIHITDARGNHIYSSLDPVPRINIADRYHFIRHKDSSTAGLVISPPLISRTTGKWTMVLTRRLDFEDGSFAGIVNIVLNLEYFQQFYRSLELGAHGLVALFDTEMHPVARYPASEKDMGKVAHLHAQSFTDKGIMHACYPGKSPLDGVMRLISFRQVGTLPLLVFAGVAEEDYLVEWHQHVWLYCGGSIIFCLVIIGFGLLWRQSVEVLRKSEENLRTIADYTYDWEYWEGSGLEILFMSPSCERVTGYSQTEFLAEPDLLYRIIHPDDQALMEHHRHDYAYAEEAAIDFRIVRRDGEIRWVSHGCLAGYGQDGIFMGRRASNRDINERRAIEEKLRAVYLYTRSLIEASLDPLVTIDAKGKIQDVNSATEKVTGVPRDKLIGSDFSDYFTEPEKARIGYQRVFSQDYVTDYPLALRHVSGTVTDVLYNATIYRNEHGEVAGIFAAARDITARKKIEEELARSNAELEQFAYVASHDLRQPLRMVTSYLILLRNKLGDTLDEEGQVFIGFAVDGAKRMDGLIQGLLEYSRVGHAESVPSPVPLAKVVAEALLNLEVAIKESGADILVAENLPTVIGRQPELVRLFQNLVGNAVTYRSGDRKPTISIDWRGDGREWVIGVHDNGIGIDPKNFERVFGIFQRLVTRQQYEGTGIGLAVCRKIVEHHGGRIWIESELGVGSAFFMTFPAILDLGTST
ncbi:MAG: PAS domain S-box protein [Alphaproteobacteria bacterium]|nr:PAS domain S-box protein [Alphaproteobacteria bacterium]